MVKPGLVLTVAEDGLRIEHPAWDYAVRVPPAAVEVLYRAREPIDREDLAASPRPGTGPTVPDGLLTRLVEMNILEEVRDSGGGCLPSPWNYWGAATWLFHARAHRTTFLHDQSEIWFEKASRAEPAPGRAGGHAGGGEEFGLGAYRGASGIARLFASRRTRREFADRPLSLGQLGELVSETFRVRGLADADYFGMLPVKSYPSSGGRHEIDTYVAALKVAGLPPGIYYYDDYRDVLASTALAPDAAALDACLGHQGMATASAALVIAVCHAERLAWKYRSPRGYLDAYVNVGHAMQNAILYAEGLRLGAWVTTAIDTCALAALMKLGEDEFPMSVLALGPPAAPGESSPA